MSLTMPMALTSEPRSRPTLILVQERVDRDEGFTASRQVAVSARNSRDVLFRHFVTSIAAVIAERGSADRSLLTTTVHLVHTLLADEVPTPQVSAGPGGGWAVEWLVDGTSLNVHFVSTGDIRMWADSPDGTELFDYELNSNWTPSDEPVRVAKELLVTMAANVRNRVPLKA